MSLYLYNYDMTKRDFLRTLTPAFILTEFPTHYDVNCATCGRQWSVGREDRLKERGELLKVLKHVHDNQRAA